MKTQKTITINGKRMTAIKLLRTYTAVNSAGNRYIDDGCEAIVQGDCVKVANIDGSYKLVDY